MSENHFAVGFGENYNFNFGQATRTTLLHTPLDVEENDDASTEAVEEIECYQLDNAPWTQDKDDDLIQVATTSASSLFLTKTGKVFVAGTIHGTVFPELTQMILHLPLKCVEIAAGRHFCLARMEGGLAVCSWGAGHFGQLALGGDSPPFMKHPTVIERLLPHVVGAPITRIAAGSWHAMAITETGSLYTWGCNRSAQCGFKPGRDPPMVCAPYAVTFEGVTTVPKIVKMAGGRSHTVALDDQGRVYAFGSCTQGQCGIYSRRRGGEASPKVVESLLQVQIVDVAAGAMHTLALTGGGRLFAFGSGYEGQLGTGSIVQMNPKPKLVGDLDFVAIEAGREWKSQQKGKRYFSIGHQHCNGEDDIIQDSSSSSTLQPSELSQVPKIVSIHASGNCSMAISSNGHLYTWGCNDVANLGVPKIVSDQLPFAEPTIPPSTTSTLRQFHTRSFDSSHNVGLPQRVDCLRHINVTSVSSSATFMWCLGVPRQDSELASPNPVGRTLYELQEAKRQKSLRPNHRPNTKKVGEKDKSTSDSHFETSVSSLPDMLQSPASQESTEKDNASIASAPVRKSRFSQSRPPKSPNATKGKRFSLPKALGKMVRRTSRGSNSGVDDGNGNG